MPERIQRRRTTGWRKPPGAVIVTRHPRTIGWGNPYAVGVPCHLTLPGGRVDPVLRTPTAAQAVASFEHYLRARPDLIDRARQELGGCDLCCWCRPGDPCHGDVLLEVANPTVLTAQRWFPLQPGDVLVFGPGESYLAVDDADHNAPGDVSLLCSSDVPADREPAFGWRTDTAALWADLGGTPVRVERGQSVFEPFAVLQPA